MRDFEAEAAAGERFRFGENWRRFLERIDERRVEAAEAGLKAMLSADLRGLRLLDVGCGSGLFSLAARRLGAEVCSFDDDPGSVACAEALRARYRPGDGAWRIARGSVLDPGFLAALGTFDVVYAWGVLHHTGAMWEAVDRACALVAPRGRLWLALYNDQGWLSRYWRAVKRTYNAGPGRRWLVVCCHAPYLLGLRFVVRTLRRKGAPERGMSLWHDMIDWLGGYPFETAKPADVIAALEGRGFALVELRTCGRRHGCNEYLFARDPGRAP